MVKKYFLIGILVITTAMALSAFRSVSYKLASVTKPINVPDNPEANFRTSHWWDGFYIPSMDVANFIAAPAAIQVSNTSVNNFRKPTLWNGIYIPARDVTGTMDPPIAPQYQYRTIYPVVVAKQYQYRAVDSKPVYQQYQYKAVNPTTIYQQYQYRAGNSTPIYQQYQFRSANPAPVYKQYQYRSITSVGQTFFLAADRSLPDLVSKANRYEYLLVSLDIKGPGR